MCYISVATGIFSDIMVIHVFLIQNAILILVLEIFVDTQCVITLPLASRVMHQRNVKRTFVLKELVKSLARWVQNALNNMVALLGIA